jgi:hypothetical protein
MLFQTVIRPSGDWRESERAYMKGFRRDELASMGVLLGALMSCGVAAQDSPAVGGSSKAESRPDPGTATVARTNSERSPQPAGGMKVRRSAGVADVLDMLKAGVSKDVIMSYIEHSTTPYRLSASELIAFKEQGVPDELTVAMLKRGSELAASAGKAEGTSPAAGVQNASAYPAGNVRSVAMDPEGYDYFRYYYLYPRTLASANERLISSYPPSRGFYPYPSGFGGFGPHRFAGRAFRGTFLGP